MDFWIAILFIIGLIIVGILYWDKCREAAGPKIREVHGFALFLLADTAQIQAEADKIIKELQTHGLRVKDRRPYYWGVSILLDHDFTVHICDPRIEIPTFDVESLLIDEQATADQTIRIMCQHSGQIRDVRIYCTLENDSGE